MRQLGTESKKFWYLQSPPSKENQSLAQGVLLMANKRAVKQMQPIFDSERTRTQLAVLLHIQDRQKNMRRLLVVVYYAQPSNKIACDQKVKLLIASLNQRYPQEAIIILGDFNRSR